MPPPNHSPKSHPTEPSEFLVAIAHRLPPGWALDLAMGFGRNSLFLARRGYRVLGIDRCAEGVRATREIAAAERLPFEGIVADLEQYPLPRERFDVVLNIRYLQRSLVPSIRAALRLGGCVVFETFLIEQLQYGHPRDPEFTLRHNELLDLFRGFRILHYEEGRFELSRGPTYLARLLAERREGGTGG
jgi:SAM-dependent methyltransferase